MKSSVVFSNQWIVLEHMTRVDMTRGSHSLIHSFKSWQTISRVSGGPNFIVDMNGNHPKVMDQTALKLAVSLADTIRGMFYVCMSNCGG